MKETGLRHCLEILDLGMEASLEEVRQAYRDCVNVWHPDRFRNNPRLKIKAEKKLKEINEAHDTLTAHLTAQTKTSDPSTRRREEEGEGGSCTSAKNEQPDGSGTAESPYSRMGSRTEAIAETGTRVFLTASSRILRMLRQWIEADGP